MTRARKNANRRKYESMFRKLYIDYIMRGNGCKRKQAILVGLEERIAKYGGESASIRADVEETHPVEYSNERWRA